MRCWRGYDRDRRLPEQAHEAVDGPFLPVRHLPIPELDQPRSAILGQHDVDREERAVDAFRDSLPLSVRTEKSASFSRKTGPE